MVIRDEKEMLMAVSKIKDKQIISQSAIGIWNQYSELVEIIGESFITLYGQPNDSNI